jgi:uncharacterized protein
MTAIFVDRRVQQSDRNLANRRKFFIKAKEQLMKSMQDLGDDQIIDVNNSKKKVKLNKNALEEPVFAFSRAGIREFVLSGNSFVVNDEIPKPEPKGGKGGSEPSDSGEGEDDFIFEMNKDEFLELFFEDLDLPNMVNKSINRTDIHTWQRTGFTSSGSPANVELRRSFKNSMGRRIALRRPKQEDLEEAEKESPEKLQLLKRKLMRIPYIDPLDMRYKHFEKVPVPTFSAVMFCLMDVSGSMTEHHKDLAKRFYMLLYYFLQKKYTQVDVVFISHTHIPKEVDEHTFFYGTETGGTVIHTSFDKILEIINTRYDPTLWNAYIAQASDGDCFGSDGEMCLEILNNRILSIVQHMCYINVYDEDDDIDVYSSLMEIYDQITAENFDMVSVSDKKDIFPVFRKLFAHTDLS